jgi:hypothetical protein
VRRGRHTLNVERVGTRVVGRLGHTDAPRTVLGVQTDRRPAGDVGVHAGRDDRGGRGGGEGVGRTGGTVRTGGTMETSAGRGIRRGERTRTRPYAQTPTNKYSRLIVVLALPVAFCLLSPVRVVSVHSAYGRLKYRKIFALSVL